MSSIADSDEDFERAAARIFRQWHEFARSGETEALLSLYSENAMLETPLAQAILDDKQDGVLVGKAELRRFFSEGARRRPNELVRWQRSGEYLTDGRRTLFWEYPRDLGDGEQIDIAEVMEIAGGLIERHRIYWGWKGANQIAASLVRRPAA